MDIDYDALEELITGGRSMARCKCGEVNNITIPMVCKCGEPKALWKTLEGKLIRVQDMTLGHLNNSIRLLAEKSEEYPASERARFEIALDILYAELGTRDKEITQATGIMAAIMRAVEKCP
jgi:hypothetical protein